MNTDYVSNHRVSHLQKRTGLGILLALAVLFASPSFGQQDQPGESAKKAPTTKKVRRRLPSHFSALVSQKQREAIYKVQADYAVQLDKLRAQLDALVAERDREIDAVLDAEQLAEVTKKRTDAKKKRAARSSKKSTSKESTEG
ncbi:MAG: hypothetical protein QF918_04660 [Pirellulaceae bacterium]|jgi:hypothetical protein|nr:hypothetical protein [Pirellulaceae bacterium]MDP6719589.1 hypothetical protein [Pirellulaceae bacterium]